MVDLLRSFLAQLLCFALSTGGFAPPLVSQGSGRSVALSYGHVSNSLLSGVPRPARLSRIATNSTARRSRQDSPSVTSLPGQSSTLMPDGRFLLLGGEGEQGPVNKAAIFDPITSTLTDLPSGLISARAWQSATVLPSGQVFVFGGMNENGQLVPSAELFDPLTKQFANLPPFGLAPRARHTATLLTNGLLLIVGGVGENGQVLGTAQLWDFRSTTPVNIDSQLNGPRSGHSANLQPDGTVLFWGGKNRAGLTLDYGEVFDPTRESFRIQDSKPSAMGNALAVAATIPEDGTDGIAANTIIALRFSSPIQMQSATSDSVNLNTAAQQAPATVVPAEGGMLLFVTPTNELSGDTEYTVQLHGIVSAAGSALGDYSFSFKTAPQFANDASSGNIGLPSGTNALGNPQDSPFLKLPRLLAPAGETAISGQVLLQSGLPLEGVTFRVGNIATQSDSTGRFLLRSVPDGHGVLLMDGRTANTKAVTYGVFQVGVDVTQKQTNILDYTMWMPVIDTAHAVSVSVPTAQETVVKTPLIPGLEFHLPAGANVTDIDGKPVDHISITPIPLGQTPFPLPKNVPIPLYFTIQPGGAVISVDNPQERQGGWLIYPNTNRHKAGTRFKFWNYDPEQKGWHVKGSGTVTADASSVVPDSSALVTALTGTSVTCPPLPPVGPNCCGPKDGEPVDLGTGLFIYEKTDLYEPDVIPIELKRTYRQGDPIARDFGVGARHPYDIFVGSTDSANCSYMDLFLPDFTRIHYTRYTNGTQCGANGTPIPVFTCEDCPGVWFGSTLYWADAPYSGHWAVYRRDGLTFNFPNGNVPNGTIQSLGLTSINDPNGNYLTITRNANYYITNITSTNGRFINFLYDANNNISQAQDGFGRTVSYSYDSSNRLIQVTDANGGVWKYGYDSNSNMTTLTDARNITYLTNQYDSNYRVIQQTQVDQSTYNFNYIIDPLNNVIETDVTDPRGDVRKVTFNQPPIYYDGFSTGGTIAADTYAAGTSIAATTSYQYQPGTYLLSSVTDALNRITSFAYDSAGNVISITRLTGTPNQATTTFAYEVDFAHNLYPQSLTRLSSVTDPLGHTMQFTYDVYGNRVSATDPLGNTTTYSNDLEGRVVSITDAAGNTTQLGYNGPELVQITDPLGRVTTFSYDLAPSGGRLITSTDPLGHVNQFQSSALDQLTSVIDSFGGVTALGYDGNGNLLTVTDQNQHTTTYTYDNMDRLSSRKDPLGSYEYDQYDANGNLTQFTDRRSKVTTYNYDALNRPSFAGYGTQAGPTYESTVNYTYDAGNRLMQVVDSITGTITSSYDGMDQLISQTTPQGNIGYAYDLAGRRQTMTVAGQPTVTYTSDAANNLTQIVQAGSTVQFSYDPANRRVSLLLPNGIATTYTYDSASQLTGLTYSLGATTLGNLAYGFDQGGRRTTSSGTFARSGIPNPVSATAYNANNQLTTWGTANLFYDANGNMTSDGTHSYTWDARNRLSGIDNGATAIFSYDAFGRRTSKTLSSSTTSFLYDHLNVSQELVGGTPTANLLSGGIDEVFQRTDSNGARSFLVDPLRSTLALTDSTGALQTSYVFEPFGNTSAGGAGNTNSFQFTGRELDPSGLYFYRARYYSPSLQRFISEDPARFAAGQLNLYSYAGNDPINGNDPFGLFAPQVHFAITVQAAIMNGYSGSDAIDLAYQTLMVDFRNCTHVFSGGPDCSQNSDPYHSNTHAMSGRKPGDKQPERCEQAQQGAQQQLEDDVRSGDIAKALHTIEDSYAAGHKGFQYWPGTGNMLAHNVRGLAQHELGDNFPSIDATSDATAAAAQFLHDQAANKNQLDSGQPVDMSKYFPQNPCH